MTTPQSTSSNSPASKANGAIFADGANALARADATTSATATKTSSRRDGFVMPELEQLLSASATAQDLPAERLAAVYEEATQLDTSDGMEMMNFGLDVQHEASAVTRDFMKEVRNVDIEELVKLAADTNKTMEELQVGDMKPGFVGGLLRKVLPGRYAKEVERVLDRHKSLSENMDVNEQAFAAERLKLAEHHGRMTAKIDENGTTYERLSEKIAVAELAYAAKEKYVLDLKEKYQSSNKASEAQLIQTADQELARAARRINTLRAIRQETLTARETMSQQLQGIENQISLIDEQVCFNRMVWDNSILMVVTDKRMANAHKAIKLNREQIETMIKERGGSIGDTLRAIIKEQANGVATVQVLAYAAAQTAKRMQDMALGAQHIRKTMKDSDGIIDRLDKLMKDSAAAAGLMSDDKDAIGEVIRASGFEDAEKLLEAAGGGGGSKTPPKGKPGKR